MRPPSSRSHGKGRNTSTPATDELDAARRQLDGCVKALEESDARFRNVIQHNADAIVVIDQDGIIQYANTMAGRIFATEPAKLTGTPFGFPIVAGEMSEIDVVVDGKIKLAELRVAESVWDGSPVSLASLRDVTDRELARRERSAQAASMIAEARIKEIFSQAPVAIAVLRGPEHRYDIANARYSELIAGRDVTGKPIREALPELAGQGIYELLDQVYSTGIPFIGTEVALMIEHTPGVLENRSFTFVYQPLRDSDGTVSGIAIVATDVTILVQARTGVEAINRRLHDQAAQLEEQAVELGSQH